MTKNMFKGFCNLEYPVLYLRLEKERKMKKRRNRERNPDERKMKKQILSPPNQFEILLGDVIADRSCAGEKCGVAVRKDRACRWIVGDVCVSWKMGTKRFVGL